MHIRLFITFLLLSISNLIYGQIIPDSFENKVFKDKIRFDERSLTSTSKFANARFYKNTSFFRTKFAIPTDMGSVYFGDTAIFDESLFAKSSNFSNDSFLNKISFCRAMFLDTTAFDEIYFKGETNFRNAAFKGYTTFLGNKFCGKTDFQIASFPNYSCFQYSTFDSTALFYGCSFHEADFSYTTFNGKNTSFGNTKYKQAANFEYSIFSVLNFKSAVFDSKANFSNTVFSDTANFNETIFTDTVTFELAKFLKSVRMRQVQSKCMILRNAEINATLSFNGAKLGSYLDLSSLKLTDKSKITFKNCELPDTINFSKTDKIYNEIDLQNARFNDTGSKSKHRFHYIYLYDADIAKLRLDYLHFRLLLTDPETKQELHIDDATPMYEALLKNFSDHGQVKSYEYLDIEYQDYIWKQNKTFSWFRFVPHYWNFYGYRKGYVFLWAICLFAIFTIINFTILERLNNLYYVDVIELNPKDKLSKKALNAVIYTSMIFFFLKFNFSNFKKKNLSGLYIVLIYLTGIVCIAYMANFVIQK